MSPPEHPPEGNQGELYAITYSTAYLALAGLLTIRSNDDDTHNSDTVEYATQILEMIKRQPETVLTLPPHLLEEMGPTLLDNARAWLND
jgi:hypothetical protein